MNCQCILNSATIVRLNESEATIALLNCSTKSSIICSVVKRQTNAFYSKTKARKKRFSSLSRTRHHHTSEDVCVPLHKVFLVVDIMPFLWNHCTPGCAIPTLHSPFHCCSGFQHSSSNSHATLEKSNLCTITGQKTSLWGSRHAPRCKISHNLTS